MRHVEGSTISRPATADQIRWLSTPAAMLAVLVVVGILLALNAAMRSIELNEGYSLVLLSGFPRVEWPAGVFTRADVATWFLQGALSDIAINLRVYDVHPPVWFYAEAVWRSMTGADLFRARLFSILLTFLNFGLVAAIAKQCKAPVALACAIAFLSYATLYTGSTLCMYPLALLFLLLGTWILLSAVQASRRNVKHRLRNGRHILIGVALAGACFGLGAATHMLILFPCIALCGIAVPSLLARRRFKAVIILVFAPMPFLAWAATYFMVPDRRDWQFPPFQFVQTISRISQDYAVAMFGGIPLFVNGMWRPALSMLLAMLLVATIVVAATGAYSMLKRTEGRFVVVGAIIMPVTLFLLSLIFSRQVSEPRYMVYSIPFLAIFIARGLWENRLLHWRTVVGIIVCLLALQWISAFAQPFARATQQVARPTMREIADIWKTGSIVLLPEAADTPGMTITFVMEAKLSWPIYLVRRDEPADTLLSIVAGRPSVFLVTLGDDFGSRAVATTREILERNDWHNMSTSGELGGRQGRFWEQYQHSSGLRR